MNDSDIVSAKCAGKYTEIRKTYRTCMEIIQQLKKKHGLIQSAIEGPEIN